MIYNFFALCLLYATCFICSIYPFFQVHVIKNHDFGMYAIAQIIFCVLITYLCISRKLQKSLSFCCNQFKHKIHLFVIIGIGLLLRASSWWAPHYTTDLFRYFSDGLNIIRGQNPYHVYTVGEEVSYPNFRTIYPLFIQIFLTLGARLDTWFDQKEKIYKFIFGLTEVFFLFWIYKKIIFRKGFLLKKSKVILFYFLTLNPLFIFECHVEGHLEIFSIFFFMNASLLLHSRRFLSILPTAVSAFLSFFSKFHGVLLYPIIFLGSFRLKSPFIWKVKRSLLLWMFWIGVASFLSLVPFGFQSLDKNNSGIHQYFESWYFSSAPFFLLHSFIANFTEVIRWLQILIFLLGLYNLTLWFRGFLKTHSLILRLILILLFLFPVQHPWYFLLGFYGVLFSPQYRLFWMNLLSCIGLNYLNYSTSFDVNTKIGISFLPWAFASFLHYIRYR